MHPMVIFNQDLGRKIKGVKRKKQKTHDHKKNFKQCAREKNYTGPANVKMILRYNVAFFIRSDDRISFGERKFDTMV